MNKRSVFTLLTLMVAASMLMAACAGAAGPVVTTDQKNATETVQASGIDPLVYSAAQTIVAETAGPDFAATGQAFGNQKPTATPTVIKQPAGTHVSNPPTVAAPNTPAAHLVEQTARDAILAGCDLGMPSVTIGAVTIKCGGKILPAPASYTDAPSGGQNVDLNFTSTNRCLTNAELIAAHGWNSNGVKPVKDGENIPWEGCGKWQMQAVGVGVYWQPFLIDFEYTVTKADGTVSVNKGPGGMYVWGATIRQLNTYTSPDQAWVLNDVTLMAREFNYGFKMDPRYGTVPGINLSLGNQWTQPDLKATCPTNSVMAAAILGGDEPSYWTAPDWEKGAWVMNSKGKGFHHLTHPGGAGYFDVWVAGIGAVSVYADDPQNYLQTLNFEEASWHCP